MKSKSKQNLLNVSDFWDGSSGPFVAALLWGPICEKCLSFCGDTYDHLKEESGAPADFKLDNVHITNDPKKIIAFGKLVGGNRPGADALSEMLNTSAPPLLVGWEFHLGSDGFGEEDFEEFAPTLFDIYLRLFSFALWTISDTLFEVLDSYLFFPISSKTNMKWQVVQSPISHAYHLINSDPMRETNFSLEDVAIASEWARTLYFDFAWLNEEQRKLPLIKVGPKNQLSRAIHLINLARAESVLPYRIAAYFTALECILTRDAGEISHTLAERAALLCKSRADERLDIYSQIKKYYKIRSRFVHGGTIDYPPQTFEEAASFLDGILRQLMRRKDDDFVNNFLFDSISADEFNKIFLSKLFGADAD